MKVLRKQEVTTGEFKVGDQIEIGKFTATCQKITRNGAIFLLDQYLDKPFKMNQQNTNKGGYEESDLRKELQEEVLDIFGSFRNIMVPFKNGDLLRIPYVEEFFGNVDAYEPSGKKQWPLMKDQKNRIAIREGEPYEWGWLQSKVESSATSFAGVNSIGHVYYYDASYAFGVRPVFRLVIRNIPFYYNKGVYLV